MLRHRAALYKLSVKDMAIGRFKRKWPTSEWIAFYYLLPGWDDAMKNRIDEAPIQFTYRDLAERLYNLEMLAVPPLPGERSGSFSSYDRSSVYNESTGLYENWGANDDGGGYVRKEGESIVALELEGPGVIWRVWSASPEKGHIRLFIDRSDEPVIDKPFRDYFEKFSDEGCPSNFS